METESISLTEDEMSDEQMNTKRVLEEHFSELENIINEFMSSRGSSHTLHHISFSTEDEKEEARKSGSWPPTGGPCTCRPSGHMVPYCSLCEIYT